MYMYHNFRIHLFKQRHGGLGALQVVLLGVSIKVQVEGVGVQRRMGRAGEGTGEPRRSSMDYDH